jgi:hypothetical protein
MIWRISDHFVVEDFAMFDVRCRASWGVMGFHWRAGCLEEVLQQRVAVLGQDGFGVELHALDGSVLWRTPMISPSGVGPGRDFQTVGQARFSTTSEW